MKQLILLHALKKNFATGAAEWLGVQVWVPSLPSGPIGTLGWLVNLSCLSILICSAAPHEDERS